MRLTVITVFVLFFFLMITLAMKAGNYQALAATAAYFAILVVFLQAGSPGLPE
ncbi:uncharacterized protein BDV14DRAFT_201672 [Aspergillus stella-maris]|uniref:uncharacterized protein n=1 Tax=Aspergillus stella-maris TaxID=1810926 RepID=UPI003CCD217A